MVKDHARKKEARAAAAASGLSYDQVDDAVRRRDGGGDLLVVDYPAPDLRGVDPCPECAGSGMSGHTWVHPGHVHVPAIEVESVCSRCLGCGRAVHEECTPGEHATDDADEIAEYFYELGGFDLSEDGEPCPSCRGLRWWHMAAVHDGDQAADEARAKLFDRARAAGVSEWETDAVGQLGELDELLGDGAQALAQTADTTVYLRFPCGCAPDLVHMASR